MRDPTDRSEPLSPTGSVAEAMNRVLGAEREAQAAVEEARQQAERTLEAARREARAILEHAERTARHIHGRTEKLAATHEALLIEAAEAQPACPDPGEVLDEALLRLAARIAGGEDG
jgi:regulator of protease activity HflC (stomatin/prohibitin superfamily)